MEKQVEPITEPIQTAHAGPVGEKITGAKITITDIDADKLGKIEFMLALMQETWNKNERFTITFGEKE